MKEFRAKPALDAGLLAAAQAVEHYEIASYGTLKSWAGELGLNQSPSCLRLPSLLPSLKRRRPDATLTQLDQHAQAA